MLSETHAQFYFQLLQLVYDEKTETEDKRTTRGRRIKNTKIKQRTLGNDGKGQQATSMCVYSFASCKQKLLLT